MTTFFRYGVPESRRLLLSYMITTWWENGIWNHISKYVTTEDLIAALPGASTIGSKRLAAILSALPDYDEKLFKFLAGSEFAKYIDFAKVKSTKPEKKSIVVTRDMINAAFNPENRVNLKISI